MTTKKQPKAPTFKPVKAWTIITLKDGWFDLSSFYLTRRDANAELNQWRSPHEYRVIPVFITPIQPKRGKKKPAKRT
jgi:hypothetical protein